MFLGSKARNNVNVHQKGNDQANYRTAHTIEYYEAIKKTITAVQLDLKGVPPEKCWMKKARCTKVHPIYVKKKKKDMHLYKNVCA